MPPDDTSYEEYDAVVVSEMPTAVVVGELGFKPLPVSGALLACVDGYPSAWGVGTCLVGVPSGMLSGRHGWPGARWNGLLDERTRLW